MLLILNPEFRRNLALERAKLRLADQMRAMRQERGWSQRETAKQAGLRWLDVWRVENCHWKHLSTTTILSLAKAFDVACEVRFRSESTGDFAPYPISWARG